MFDEDKLLGLISWTLAFSVAAMVFAGAFVMWKWIFIGTPGL